MFLSKRRLSARSIYLIYSGLTALFMSTIFTVDLVYQVQIAHLTPLQLVLVGTVLETVCFLCQVPTGVLADVFGRRLAIITGTFLIGAGFVLEGSIPLFTSILLAQVLWGLGATFTDGALQAWISGEVGEDNVGPIFTRSTQIGLVGGLLGALVSVGLASIRLNLPVIVGGIAIAIVGVFLLLFMPEHGFRARPKEERETWQAMGNTLRNGLRIVRYSSMLLIILLIELLYGLSSEGYDRLSRDHLLSDFTFPSLGPLKPVVWFAIFQVVGTVVSLLAMEVIRRRVNTNHERIVIGALFLFNVLNVLSILVFALTGNFFLAAAAYLACGVTRTVSDPIWNTWLTQHIDEKVRATVFSLVGEMNALGQIVGGPPVGYIGSAFSLRAALTAVSIILSPVLLLFAYAARKVRREKAEGETVAAEKGDSIPIG